MSDTTIHVVKLKTVPGKKDGKSKSQEFPISQANALLKMKKSAWVLDDAKYKWNGTEIAPK